MEKVAVSETSGIIPACPRICYCAYLPSVLFSFCNWGLSLYFKVRGVKLR
jgi:hypothetical protein